MKSEMKRLVLFIMLLVLTTLAAAILSTPVNAQSGCGFKPFKPFVPIGCKDLVLECRCDSKGKNCRWEWVCVPS